MLFLFIIFLTVGPHELPVMCLLFYSAGDPAHGSMHGRRSTTEVCLQSYLGTVSSNAGIGPSTKCLES